MRRTSGNGTQFSRGELLESLFHLTLESREKETGTENGRLPSGVAFSVNAMLKPEGQGLVRYQRYENCNSVLPGSAWPWT